MKSSGVTYCDICTAEIPADEPDNEFSSPLLAQKGHCHAEHLAERNELLRQFDEIAVAIGQQLDPSIPTFAKNQLAAQAEQKRDGQLKRVKKAKKLTLVSSIHPLHPQNVKAMARKEKRRGA